jgi:hypothetical protein
VSIPINDPKHWRDRAEKPRTIAEELTDPDAKIKQTLGSVEALPPGQQTPALP